MYTISIADKSNLLGAWQRLTYLWRPQTWSQDGNEWNKYGMACGSSTSRKSALKGLQKTVVLYCERHSTKLCAEPIYQQLDQETIHISHCKCFWSFWEAFKISKIQLTSESLRVEPEKCRHCSDTSHDVKIEKTKRHTRRLAKIPHGVSFKEIADNGCIIATVKYTKTNGLRTFFICLSLSSTWQWTLKKWFWFFREDFCVKEKQFKISEWESGNCKQLVWATR